MASSYHSSALLDGNACDTATAIRLGMRVFWPTTGIARPRGDVLGWRVEDTLCVVGIVEQWIGQEGTSWGDTPPAPQRLGRAMPVDHTSSAPLSNDLVFWLDNTKVPVQCSQPVELVLYAPPDRGRIRFLRLRLALGVNTRNAEMAVQDGYSPSLSFSNGEDGIMDRTIELINFSNDVQEMISDPHPPSSDPRRITTLLTGSNTSPIYSTIRLTLRPLGLVAQTLIDICSTPLPFGLSIRSYSATINQLCLRLAQTTRAPERFQRTREVAGAIHQWSESYILFWNTVWLIANDLILGYAARQLILLLAVSIARDSRAYLATYMVDIPISILNWLNDWPVGLKLNTPLSQFFCTSLSIIIASWGSRIGALLEQLGRPLVQALALLSLGGLTFTLTAVDDVISLLTLHLYLCHVVMRTIYKWQRESLGGLWNLFRGNRWNVLRQRTDSYAYDVDQLFLGTLLFTVSAFLFPTVLTYAALFGLIQLALVGVKRTLSCAVNALNVFPLFELMLRIKEPSRLPAGVYVQLRSNELEVPDGPQGETRYTIRNVLELKNSPKSFSDILFPVPAMPP